MLPAPPFVAHDFNRHTCIVVRVGPKKVTYVPMSGLNLVSCSRDSFMADWRPMSHSVRSAAKVYMRASDYHRMTAGAFEQLQRFVHLDPAIGSDAASRPLPKVEPKAYHEPPRPEPEVRKPDTVYTLVPGEPPKLPRQATIILQVLAANGGSLTREQLLAKLDPDELKTKQPVQRILAFYQPQLVKLGLMTVA